MRKAQSILEYLVVLTAIVFVIVIHTFGPFSVRRAMNRALDNQFQEIQDLATGDYTGERVAVPASN